MLALLALIFASSPAQAFVPPMEIFGSPASLKDYLEWNSTSSRFDLNGSETEAYRSFMNSIYAGDMGLWELDQFFPEATAHLQDLRAHLCPEKIAPRLCALPDEIKTFKEMVKYKSALLDSETLANLSKRWNLSLIPWEMPLHAPDFSILVGPENKPEIASARFWEMPQAQVPWRVLRYPLVWDLTSTRAGMSGPVDSMAPVIYGLKDDHAILNDWVLRDRSMEFAHEWKHAISARASWKPTNKIVEAKELQWSLMFDSMASDFERTYNELLPKVSGKYLAQFQAERARGDYPEEVYQHVAYAGFRELTLLLGNYFALAPEHRADTSERQQALEALLTAQRYSQQWRFFVFDLSTLMEPLSSNARVLDQSGDYTLAVAYVFEHIKAILGIDGYEGKALFPALGKALLDPVLFAPAYLKDFAPDILELLKGRELAAIPLEEQLSILKKFVQPAPGKVRPMSVYRMGILLFSHFSEDELHRLADVIHESHSKNFH